MQATPANRRKKSKELLQHCLLLLLTCSSTIVSPSPRPAMQSALPDPAHLWQAYAARFISSDGRVIDPQGGDRTTSEGQSYALFFALVNNDRAQFEKLFTWTTNNLASGDLGSHLPAWSWGKRTDGTWGILDPNSASDSDLWIAYDLIEAGRLWNDQSFSTIGRRLAALIAHREVATLPGVGPVVLPGPTGFRYDHAWILNPSYTPLFILERLAAADKADKAGPKSPWGALAATLPTLIESSQRNGFAMNWVSYTPGEGFTPCDANGKVTPTAEGSYDAIRVYLWAGMLPQTTSAAKSAAGSAAGSAASSVASSVKLRILKALPGMNNYLSQHPAPPEKVNGQGIPEKGEGPVGFSAALLPYLESSGNQLAMTRQLARVRSQLDEKTGLYGPGFGSGPTYYDQNLILFGSSSIEKLFQFGSNGELLVGWSR